jgi:ribosome recycling factor
MLILALNRLAEGKGGGGAAAAAADAAADAFDLKPFQKQMAAAMEHLQHELANIRTGRATPGMLDHLKIEAYGEKMPMKAVGTVSVRDSQLLAVTMFDPGLVEAVVAGIASSPLKLNPRAEGQEVLVPVPSPTAETLAAMGKMCKGEGETAKVQIRHARKVALDAVKGMGSEDGRRRAEKEVQQLTDRYIADIEAIVAAKQKDILKHNS